MDETTFCETLATLIEDAEDFQQEGAEGDTAPRVRSFEEAMVMTQNAGLVVTLADGSKFFVTVVRA